MTECPLFRKEMLKNPIRLTVEDTGLEFGRAKELADKEAGRIAAEPLLLAWYNAKTGEFAPQVTCCSEDKPAWLVYAESRGGTICIDINDEEFVFIYRPFEP
jgi:hypothetical protein